MIISFSMIQPYFSYIFESRLTSITGFLAAMLLVGIPVIFFILICLRFYFKARLTKIGILGLAGLWFASFTTLFVIGSGSMKYFNEEATITEVYPLNTPDADTLVLSALEDDGKGIATQLGPIKMSKDRFISYDVQLNVVKGDKPYFELQKQRQSRGLSLDEARKLTRNVLYNIEQNNNTLSFNNYFTLKPGSKWRKQQVFLELKVPEGKTIIIDKSLGSMLNKVPTINNSARVSGHSWTMLENGLNCLDCEEEETNNESMGNRFEPVEKILDYKDFNALNIQGQILVHVSKSSDFGIIANGSEADIEDLQFEVKDEKFYIKSRLGNRGKNLKLDIRMPELNSFKASDAGDIYITDFDQKNMEIELVGSNELQASFELEKLNLLINGSSEVQLKGKAQELVAEINGTSQLDADQFPVKKATIIALGSTSSELYVTDSLYHKNNFSSHIKVERGNPKKVKIE